jgi:CheY-like chemotaxis protein
MMINFNDTPVLKGRSVLVLEDEMMVAMLLEDMLAELGCRVVGPAATASDALALLAAGAADMALLDVNLSCGQSGYPVAEALARRNVPFAFVTGYGAGTLHPDFRGRPTLQKPFHFAALVATLTGMAPATQAAHPA